MQQTYSTFLPASAKNVLRILTNEQQIEIWSGEPAKFDPKEEGNFSILDGWIFGVVEQINERNLLLSWRSKEWEDGQEQAQVVITLTPVQEHTQMDLAFANNGDEEEIRRQSSFWMENVIMPFEDYVMIKYG